MFDDLGDTADKVAESLKQRGIRGIRDTVRILNPIVRYARTRLAGNLDMNVFTGKSLHVVNQDGKDQDIQLPDAVVAFLDAFNKGAYPELESSY